MKDYFENYETLYLKTSGNQNWMFEKKYLVPRVINFIDEHTFPLLDDNIIYRSRFFYCWNT